MAKYRKKPVVIEAEQYIPTDGSNRLLFFLDGCTGWHMSDGKHGIVIPTLEGDMIARPGDWIIKGVNGEFYPCKPDIFQKSYERVVESDIFPNTYEVVLDGSLFTPLVDPSDKLSDDEKAGLR